MATTAQPSFGVSDILHALAYPFKALADGITRISFLNERTREVEFLLSLSDAQLAARGLRRDQVVQTVFAAYLSE